MNGKILQSELINKKHDKESKTCIGFEYELLVDDGNSKTIFPVRFTKVGDKTWTVEMVFEHYAYRIMFDVPKNNMDLVMIAAFGLRNLQYVIRQEVERKSIIDFTIGDETKEM